MLLASSKHMVIAQSPISSRELQILPPRSILGEMTGTSIHARPSCKYGAQSQRRSQIDGGYAYRVRLRARWYGWQSPRTHDSMRCASCVCSRTFATCMAMLVGPSIRGFPCMRSTFHPKRHGTPQFIGCCIAGGYTLALRRQQLRSMRNTCPCRCDVMREHCETCFGVHCG